MDLPNDIKLKAYKSILPKVESDNMMPICILIGEYLAKDYKAQKDFWDKISKGIIFPEIKIELSNQNRGLFFLPHTRVQFIKNQIKLLKC